MVRVKVERIDKIDNGYNVKYRYADMRVAGQPLYGARCHSATDELDALVKFKAMMSEVNYQVITEEK
jgi:hypothetical protein